MSTVEAVEKVVIRDSIAMNHAFDRMGGVKLKVVAPATFADGFFYSYVRGAIEAHLANFGKY